LKSNILFSEECNMVYALVVVVNLHWHVNEVGVFTPTTNFHPLDQNKHVLANILMHNNVGLQTCGLKIVPCYQTNWNPSKARYCHLAWLQWPSQRPTA
jgi:hypothetical protein